VGTGTGYFSGCGIKSCKSTLQPRSGDKPGQLFELLCEFAESEFSRLMNGARPQESRFGVQIPSSGDTVLKFQKK